MSTAAGKAPENEKAGLKEENSVVTSSAPSAASDWATAVTEEDASPAGASPTDEVIVTDSAAPEPAPIPPGPASFDYVAIGGGVAAGYWAWHLVNELSQAGESETTHSIAIITSYPEGVVPYERPALTKAAMDPTNAAMRNPANPAFPCTMKGSMLQPLSASWYAENGIRFYWASNVTAVDAKGKLITLEQRDGEVVEVVYGKLLIATGATSRTMEGDFIEPVWAKKHPDVTVAADGSLSLSDPRAYGFGSRHYPRDLGCAVALTQAMTRKEEVGQVPCEDPVVVIGGGFISMEVAAGIVSSAPHLKVLIVMSGSHMLESFLPPAVSDLYERKLTAKGVQFARNYRFKSWWPTAESGEFATLAGDPFNLRTVEPKPFRKCSKQFTDCRGVILVDPSGKEVRVPARFVVCGVGAVPNSSLFRDTLQLGPRGHIITDGHLRTNAEDVYAAGDVCCFPLPLDESQPTKLEHVQHARDSAAHVARCMVHGPDNLDVYDPVPYFYTRFLDLAWKFYGLPQGEPVVLGLKDFETTKELAVIWVKNKVVVGVLLGGGTADMQARLPGLARTQPGICSTARLARMSVQEYFQDPSALAPPPLTVGDFEAEMDEETIVAQLKKHDYHNSGFVQTMALESIMKALGGSWSPLEMKEIRQVLDPNDKGVVRHSSFVKWWRSEQDTGVVPHRLAPRGAL